MNTINMSTAFAQWLASVPDVRLMANVMRRIAQATLGNFGYYKSVSDGVLEMRIHYGAGWRVYYAQEGSCVYLLLHAGNKASQKKMFYRAVSKAKCNSSRSLYQKYAASIKKRGNESKNLTGVFDSMARHPWTNSPDHIPFHCMWTALRVREFAHRCPTINSPQLTNG